MTEWTTDAAEAAAIEALQATVRTMIATLNAVHEAQATDLAVGFVPHHRAHAPD